jgi:hypothetical protein
MVRPARKGRMQEKNRISVTFEPEHYEELRRIAKRKRVSLAWVVRDALGLYLAAETPLFHPLPEKGGRIES